MSPYGRAKKREKIKLNAYGFDRKHFWSCDYCGSHNFWAYVKCQVCDTACWKTRFKDLWGYMPELLSIGYPVSMAQNTIYALPARRTLLFTEGTPTLEQSNTLAFSASKAVTLDANNQAELAGGFIRCTTGAITVTLKALS